jgi:hypothetical protein
MTQDLPHGKPANCLVPGNDDPRNILFTLFHEENNGRPTCPSLIQEFPRNYDFTFGDIEPVVIGACFHTILTDSTQRFTLLLDNIDNKSPPDYWSIFYDLRIDTKTSDEIHAQARKLVVFFESLERWNLTAYDFVLLG